jgi:hypothetical protein
LLCSGAGSEAQKTCGKHGEKTKREVHCEYPFSDLLESNLNFRLTKMPVGWRGNPRIIPIRRHSISCRFARFGFAWAYAYARMPGRMNEVKRQFFQVLGECFGKP